MFRHQQMKQYVQEHLPLYIFVSIIMLMGVVFGVLMVHSLAYEQKQEISSFLDSFLQMLGQGRLNGQDGEMIKSMLSNLKWLLLIWILGLSVIGLPFILLLNFLKGVLIGFSVTYLVQQLSWHGLLLAMASMAPQYMVMIPAFIMCSVASIAFSIYVVKQRFVQPPGEVLPHLLQYTIITFVFMVLTVFVSLFEVYITPYLQEQVAAMLLIH